MLLQVHESTKSYYETCAEEYFRSTHATNLYDLWEKFQHNIPKNARVLDLGCGSGRDIKHFASIGTQVIGMDYSFSLLQRAKIFSQQTVILTNFLTLPFKDSSFDAVWAMGSLLHTPRPQVTSALSEIHRILKSHSLLFSSVKKGDGHTIDEKGRYFEFYQQDEWRKLLDETHYYVKSLEETIEVRKTDAGGKQEVTWIECFAIRS